MKPTIQSLTYFIALIAISVLSGCGKSGTTPSKKNAGTTTTMQPVSSTFVQTGGVPITYQYTYDSNNNLTKYASPGAYEVDIDPHTVTQISIGSDDEVTNTYAYSGPSNAPVDIYTTIPTQMSITSINKNLLSGTSLTLKGKLWAFEGGKDITKMYTSDQGGENINFTYDANDNLKTITFISLSGTRPGLPYDELDVTAVDNHPSPFSAVKGYNVISYPQSFISDYGLAFCKNNPTQIIYKQFDYDKGDLEPNEQDDFTYTYNDLGYPTSVTVNVSYLGLNPSNSVRNYTYTYK